MENIIVRHVFFVVGGGTSVIGTEHVRIADAFKAVRKIAKELDSTNIKILSAMWKFGPRNLLEVSRRTGIPFTSVYHRMSKLEKKSGRVAYLIPQIAKLGMTRVVVLATARAGYEDQVRAAIKIPNFWRSINPCEGNFTHHSVHAVPVKFLKEFKEYIRRLSENGFINQYRIISTGEQIPNFPNFKYYDPDSNTWRVPWGTWLKELSKSTPNTTIVDPENYLMVAGKKDLLIVKELEKNGRKRFAELAPIVGITLQGVKYHYDKILVPRGIVKNFAFDVYPYPIEVSAYHEVMLDFTSERSMRRFLGLIAELFFVLGVSKVLHKNSLLIRTCILQSQLLNMFAFFSEMAKAGILESYSSVRLNFEGRETQTISYELFDEKIGWVFNLRDSLSDLRKLTRSKTTLPSRRATAHQYPL